MSTPSFNPATDIPSQSGRVFFITGGTTGLGAESIAFIAKQSPSHIFFSGRNESRADGLISKLKQESPSTALTFIQCDNSNLKSVQAAAQTFLAKSSRLDVLICNAGIMATPASMSADGYEIQFATNHLGHALLIKLLLPCLLKTASEPSSDVRIINLSSVAYTTAPPAGIEFSKLKTPGASYGPFYAPNKWMCYGQSKLANLLYPIELASRYPSIKSVAVHPGFVKTTIFAQTGFIDRQIINMKADKWLQPAEGAYTQTWAATTPKDGLGNGAYYEPIGVKAVPSTKEAKDMKLARELWEWTEKELQPWS